MNKARGRPRGGSDAKERILEAARLTFADRGYDGATLRTIAQQADVDPALISYYFGSKQGLFVQAMSMALGPSEVLAAAMEAPPEELADRLLAAVLNSWEDPERGPAMRTFVLMALQHDDLLRAFREYLEREVIGRAADNLAGPGASRRATAAITVIIGVIFNRYILRLAPAAHVPLGELHAAVSPALRAALAGGPQRIR